MLPTAIVRAPSPRSANAPSTTSSAMQWLPTTTRSGNAAVCPINVTRPRVPASSADASASISRKPSAWEKLVTEPEPFAVGNATGPSSPATNATRTNSLRPSSEAMRIGTSASMVRAASGGRPARARITGATDRLARLERDAMDENLSELRHDAVREIARALRGAAREHDDVADLERRAHGKFERHLIVGKGAEGNRFAARFHNRRGDDGAVAVVDPCRRERATRRHQFVAGREHRHFGLAHHLHRRDAAGREHADLARRDAGLAA